MTAASPSTWAGARGVPIGELAGLVAAVTGFAGQLRFDTSKPDGTPRKLLDVTRLRNLGWAPQIALREGVAATYRWFVEHPLEYRG